jgi:hypothetical protein
VSDEKDIAFETVQLRRRPREPLDLDDLCARLDNVARLARKQRDDAPFHANLTANFANIDLSQFTISADEMCVIAQAVRDRRAN